MKTEGQVDYPRICFEKEFVYSDSANGEKAVCSYIPTGIISFDDGSKIISTELTVRFPNRFELDWRNNDYRKKIKNYQTKEHGSSGTVFCLDSNQEKTWELIFKDEKAEFIKKFNDSSFVVVGTHINLKHVWMALISQKGEIAWKKDFKHKRQIFTSSLAVHNECIYLLHESRGTILYHTKPNTVKKHRFFETSENDDLYLMKVDSKGFRKWRKAIDKRKNSTSYGDQLFVTNENIYLTYSHIGPELELNGHTYKSSKKLIMLNLTGRVLKNLKFDGRTLINTSGGLLYCTSADDDTLNFYRGDSLVKNFVIPNDIKRFWVNGAFVMEDQLVLFGSNNNNLGVLLMSFDLKFNLNWYWIKEGERLIEPGGYCKNKNGSFSIAAEKWKKTDNGYIRWIYVNELEKKGVTQTYRP